MLPHELIDDLPIKGRSAFDEVFGSEIDGKFIYDIPENFSNLLSKYQKDVANPVTVLIPLGRSLQRPFSIKIMESFDSIFSKFWENAAGLSARGSARILKEQRLLFNPFRYPRVIVGPGVRKEKDRTVKKQIFLGYMEPYNQIEVISFNSRLGRMEFQLVTNYKPGAVPKVQYVKRKKCTRCHVAGGPIFSRFPWRETNNSANVRRSLFLTMSNGEQVDENGPITHYQGAKISTADNAYQFEQSVQVANMNLLTSSGWSLICSGSLTEAERIQCRKNVLRSAFNASYISKEFKFENLDLKKGYEKVFGPMTDPLFEEREPFEILDDFDEFKAFSIPQIENILKGPQLTKMVDDVRSFNDETTAPFKNGDNEGHRHFLSFIVGLRNTFGNLFTEDKDFIGKSKEDIFSSLTEAVEHLSDEILLLPYFDIVAIKAQLKASTLNKSIRVAPAKVSYEQLHAPVKMSGSLSPFNESCVDCHSGPSFFPPPFLFGKTLESVENKIGARKQTLRRYTELLSPAMPPHKNDNTHENLKAIHTYLDKFSINVSTSENCEEYEPIPEESSVLDGPSQLADKEAQGLFKKYCMECHGEYDFEKQLPFESPQELRSTKNVFEFLRAAKMPDCKEGPQNGAPSLNERIEMLKWLKSN